MRVLLFANNWLGWQVAEAVRAAGDTLAAVVVHPPERQRFGRELAAAAAGAPLVDARALGDAGARARLAALAPDLGVSAMFGYVLRPEVLALPARGAVNLHPAYLPYNRGAHPNVWSIVEGTPAGVTLHWMDAGLDTGAVVARERVPVEPVDTGETLYRKLERAALALFARSWPAVREGRGPALPQDPGGTAHRARDLGRLDEIRLDAQYSARELLDLLRARTFPPHDGAYFVADDGRRVHVEVGLRYGDPADQHAPPAAQERAP